MRRKTMKRRPAKKVSAAVKTYVNRQIHTNQENKVWTDYGTNQTIATANASAFTNRNLIPTLSQGTGNSQRIGNSVKVRRAFIRGHVNLTPYNAQFNPLVGPIMIKIWLLKSKLVNSPVLADTQMAADFFEANNTTVGPQANMLDMILTENKEKFVIFKTKKFELGATSSQSAVAALPLNLDNSKFTIPFYFSFGKHLKKVTRYNDASTSCTNNNLFLAFQAVYAEGSSQLFNGAEFHYVTRVEYEDA